MPKKTSKRGLGDSADVADPRFAPVAKAFARIPGFSLMESKSGAMRGLMLEGKSFGMSQHGRFILKLDEERVAALVAKGIGEPFSPGVGRVMKGWLEVTHPKADWVALAKEAHRMARAHRPFAGRTGQGPLSTAPEVSRHAPRRRPIQGQPGKGARTPRAGAGRIR